MCDFAQSRINIKVKVEGKKCKSENVYVGFRKQHGRMTLVIMTIHMEITQTLNTRIADIMYRGMYLGLPQEELEVTAAEDAVVLHVIWQVDRAGPVDRTVHFHIRMNNVQVRLFVLEQRKRKVSDKRISNV